MFFKQGLDYEQVGAELEQQADEIVAQTLNRSESAYEDGNPLFLVMGENHADPAHKILQMLVIEKLEKAGVEISVGFEMDHNSLDRSYIGQTFKKTGVTSPEIYKPVSDRDPSGVQALRNKKGGDFGQRMMYGSGLFARFAFLVKKTRKGMLSFCFNDAAKRGSFDFKTFREELEKDDGNPFKALDTELDLSDTDTYEAILAYNRRTGKTDIQNISVTSPAGMAIRNEVMVKKSLEHVRLNTSGEKPHIHIIITGDNHVIGNKEIGKTYEDSLCGILKREGQELLAVKPDTKYEQPDGGYFEMPYHPDHGLSADELIRPAVPNVIDSKKILSLHKDEEVKKDLEKLFQTLKNSIEVMTALKNEPNAAKRFLKSISLGISLLWQNRKLIDRVSKALKQEKKDTKKLLGHTSIGNSLNFQMDNMLFMRMLWSSQLRTFYAGILKERLQIIKDQEEQNSIPPVKGTAYA